MWTLPAEDRPQRGADFFRREVAGADLVEQRLERVIVVAVDEDNLGVRVLERLRCTDAGEASAENEHPRARR